MLKWCLFGALVLVFAVPDADARRRKKRRGSATWSIKKKAKEHFKNGRKLFRKKRYVQAVVEFKKAYALRKHPAIQFNIAMSYAFVQESIAAARHTRIYLKAAKGKARALPKVLLIVLHQTGVLTISTPDPKAEIFVDGRRVGKGKAEVIVMIGNHSVDIRLGKRIAMQRNIVIKPREERVWEIKEIPREASGPRRIVGVRRIVHPPSGTRPAVDVSNPAPGNSPKSKKLHVGWFVTTAALAIATVGAGLGVDKGLTKPTFKDYDSGGSVDRDLYNKVIAYRNTAISLFAAGGALGIAAVVIAIFTKWKKRERAKSAITIAPVIGPSSIGLTLRWDP